MGCDPAELYPPRGNHSEAAPDPCEYAPRRRPRAVCLGTGIMRTRWTRSRAHHVVSITSPERLRNLRALEECELIGPPGNARMGVDVATGRVLLEEHDLVLGGPHPLR